ncbi:MAG: hypothetical protein EOM58_11775 [Clostridia bacterium]|nr:hypothetical protein [Clostridia bacterium]
MSDWAGVIRKAAAQDNLVIQHYVNGLVPFQIAEKTGFPRFFVEQTVSRIVAQYPALTGRHLRARKGRDPVSKWPNARLVIVGKEWSESVGEWEEMNHETV